MAQVTFNKTKFLQLFPQFLPLYYDGKIDDEILTSYFDMACAIVGNGDNSLIPYAPDKYVKDREHAINFALCHLLTLDFIQVGQSGRIASASQGSISTSFDLVKADSTTAQFWLQTPCGARYWMFTLSYRKGGRFYGGKDFHPYG